MARNKIAFRDADLGGVAYWYGVVELVYKDGRPAPTDGLGVIRARVATSYTSNLPIQDLQAWTSGGWTNLPLSSDPAFLFELPANGSVQPSIIWSGVRHPSFHILNNGQWQVFASGTNAVYSNCGCFVAGAARNQIVFRNVDKLGAANPAKMFGDVATQVIGADSLGVPRCMPGDHSNSRNYPFLLEWTANRLFYSATNDPTTARPQCPVTSFPGMHIIRTFLKDR